MIVSRTFSKTCSLCFQRIGYFIGAVESVGALDKIRDSYNVNGLAQVVALATLKDLAEEVARTECAGAMVFGCAGAAVYTGVD